MANGGEDSRTSRVQANFFGISREHAPMPESYLRELQRLVGAASAHLGVVVSSNERHAYWIDGRSLGVLSYQRVTDEDTVITGRIRQIDTTVSVAIKVACRLRQNRELVTVRPRAHNSIPRRWSY